MARTAIATARSTLGSARSAISARTALGVYNVPIELVDLGVTNMWDMRNGHRGVNGSYIPAVIGGHGLNTINVNTATAYTANEFSIDLDGTNDYAITTSSILNSSSSLTTLSAFAWSKRDVTNVQNVFSNWQTTGALRGWQLRYTGTNVLQVYVSSTGANVFLEETTAGVNTGTDWHHVGFVYNGGTPAITIYHDGASVTSTTITGPIPSSIFRSSYGFNIGMINSSTGSPVFFFNGKIGVTTIFQHVALSSSQVSQLYTITRNIMGV